LSINSPILNNLYVALIHYPVMNKKKAPIGSALTTIDMHDIARASMTFGVKGFYVVTPYEDQAVLANQVIEHWTKGAGGVVNPDRKKALELIQVTETFEQAVDLIKVKAGVPAGEQVVTIATTAKETAKSIAITKIRQKLKDNAPHVICFGTAWGLTEAFIEDCDLTLDPIYGSAEYNHLSVRSAASIYLDRIINGR